MPIRLFPVQDTVPELTIRDGVLLRSDGIAVAYLRLTPPDIRLFGDAAMASFLRQFGHILQSCPDRLSLHTMAVPLDVSPVLTRLAQAQQVAPDMASFTILGSLQDWLNQAWGSVAHLRVVQWILAVPSLLPEQPPQGTWAALQPTQIRGRRDRLVGDAVHEVLLRARRLLAQLSGLGLEPAPDLLPATEIRAWLRAGFDPIGREQQSLPSLTQAPSVLQLDGTPGAGHA